MIQFIRDICDLIKLRILFAAMLTVFLGYFMLLDSLVGRFNDLWGFLGIACIFSAAAALNHYFEQDIDSKMERTQNRPLPSGRVNARFVVGLILLLGVVGSVILYVTTNFWVLFTALLTLVLYDFVYTPLKRISSFNTFVGAIPGAMPVLCGWFLVHNELTMPIFVVFLIFYLWQFPHFYAIAWVYKEAYEAGGLKMVSLGDVSGDRTARYIFLSSVTFILVLYVPFFMKLFGWLYILGVSVLNVVFLYFTLEFYKSRSMKSARKIVLFSVLYPILIVFFVCLEVLL